ncbi:MAG TPA: transporter substrate-binding protein, partial [Gemmataceae bacterium]|nr:transporter substrate-binding protein [Gemmataceae bacterium]
RGKKAPVGPASDIFSLGVLLYQLLTGELPFQAEATWQVMHQITTVEPQKPSSRSPACPAALEAICLRCLEKNPADRYGSAEALAEDLSRFLRGEELSPGWRRRPRWLRWALAGAALGLLAILGWAVGSFLGNGERFRDSPGTQAVVTPSQSDKGAGTPSSILKIGVLIKLRGPRARIDQTILDGVTLAVEELNGQGDNLQIVKGDGWLTPEDFRTQAKRFVVEHKVTVLIGCAAPEDRKEIEPLLETYRQMLMVPARSETIEAGKRVFCLEPPLTDLAGFTAKWVGKSGTRVLWVDDETEMAMATGRALKTALADLPTRPTFHDRHVGAKGFDWDKLATDFADPAVRPNVVVGSLHSDDLYHVFATFKAPPPAPTTVVMDLTEEDKAQFVDVRELKDIYVLSTWSGLDRTKGSRLAKRLQAHPEMAKRASCNTASAYAAVHLWRQAARAAGSLEPDRVRQALAGQHFDGLGEPITIDGMKGHATRVISLGQLDATGKVKSWD